MSAGLRRRFNAPVKRSSTPLDYKNPRLSDGHDEKLMRRVFALASSLIVAVFIQKKKEKEDHATENIILSLSEDPDPEQRQ